MESYSNEIKIPKERIAVLIGKEGEVKKEIEERTNVELSIDSNEGVVLIKGKDAISVFNSFEIIKAIARGFNPEIAYQLLKMECIFDIINILDHTKAKSQLQRLKGRVIGKEGKSRATIESLTETKISVYGKTIGIIGLPDYVAIARKALESLLNGSPHSNVYKWLEKQRKIVKRREFEDNPSEYLKKENDDE